MTYSKPQIKVEEEILKDLMTIIETNKNKSPWHKPWTPTNSGIHTNFLTGHEYSGANPLLLGMYMFSRDQDLPLWAGYSQAKKEGFIVKKGSKCARILRPNLLKIELKDSEGKAILDKEGNQEFIIKTRFKGATVFNIQDMQGKDTKSQEKLDKIISDFKALCIKTSKPLDERCKLAHDRLMIFKDQLEGGLKHGSDSAFYRPSLDMVVMPDRETFKSDEAYLSTLAHEFSHATGNSKRLNRAWLKNYSKRSNRAFEELTAEFSSLLISNRLQISCDTQNHISYFESWLSALDGKASNLMKVFSSAVKAADLVVGEQ